MATVFSDDFDRSNNDSLGTDWVENETAASDIKIASNIVQMNMGGDYQTDTHIAYMSGSAPSVPNDQKVQLEIRWDTTPSVYNDAGPVCRCDGSSGDPNNMYIMSCYPDEDELRLFEEVSDSWSQLGSTVSQTIADSTWYTAQITAEGTAIKCNWEASEKISVTDSSLSSGVGGFYCDDYGFGELIDINDFLVEDFVVGGAIASQRLKIGVGR